MATTIPATWTADPVHSSAGFAVRHMVVATFRGGFDRIDGGLDLTGDQARLTGEVDVASIAVKDENLYAHLQSPEFFDAESHPRLTFASREIVREGDDVAIAGELTIKGTTLPVAARGTWHEIEADISGSPRIGIDVETQIDRTQFGLSWNAPLPKGGFALADEVTLSVHLEFVPAEA